LIKLILNFILFDAAWFACVLGAVVTPPGFHDLLALAAGWAVMTPLLVWLASYYRREI
jgi:hypothetical protein